MSNSQLMWSRKADVIGLLAVYVIGPQQIEIAARAFEKRYVARPPSGIP